MSLQNVDHKSTRHRIRKLLCVLYESLIPCHENRGHNYSPASQICLNQGCNEERGSWEFCQGSGYREGQRHGL